MNKLTKAGFELIKYYEGLRLNAYQDTGGVWTIGYGHTAARGAPYPKAGMRITKQEAESIFLNDLKYFENWVKKLVNVPLNDSQYSALVSFCYNLGPGNLKSSTLLRKLNAKDYNGASNEFSKWVYDDGIKLNGLVKRRASEKNLFLSKSPSASVSVPSTSSDNWFIRLLKLIFSGGQR